MNKNSNITSEHICIEPFEILWLNSFKNIKIIRNKIEDLNFNWKSELLDGDLCFFDSSMLKPYGDILCEF